ncbi:TRAP transporter substrate-binding protein [Marinobacter sp.]|uniref:TRAP transporter substrate-binding protein n=1 Tax=Marinobacter sp. TaxID=50741 RepID=UPI002B265EF9|nr:TRAP transporter substrate-binding protein [Marinobacter sp.]
MKNAFTPLISTLAVSMVLSSGMAYAADYTLRLSHTGAPGHHYQTITEQFADEIAEKTNGAVEIQIFPADQLGNQLESVEGTMIGTLEMTLASDTVLSNWVPDMGALNLPFLFADMDEYLEVVEGPVGEMLSEKVEQQGAVILGWWGNGMRHVTNSVRPINHPEDLKGLKIRVPEGKVFVDTFNTLGAGATVMSFGELYSALQLGVVDGQENPPAHILTQNFNEVQDYVSRTGHIHMGSPLIMSAYLFNSMPEDIQKTLLEVGHEYNRKHIDLIAELEAEQWQLVEERGMKINDVDKAEFRKAVQPVYDDAKGRFSPEILNQLTQ